jgi:TorA maturation chaperone TorD/Pyruvate/2-oxoacid:ferredoxin oxidoreductase delta subunit
MEMSAATRSMNTVTRATIYAALAATFRPPFVQPAESVPASELLTALEALAGSLAHTWRMALTSTQRTESPLDELARIYDRLFVGPLPPLVHPYESVYRTLEGRLMGEVTMQVIQSYAEAGVALADGFRDLPDHVAVELEFMAYLAGEEAAARAGGDEALVVTHLLRQVAFLRDHLTRWIPHFCHRVTEADPDGYYGQAAVTLAAFIVYDLDLATAAWQSLAFPITSATSPPVNRQVGIWKVAFRPERSFIPCTLCNICTEVCHPNALQLAKDKWEIALIFDPARCDGCDYCIKYCPESILRLDNVATANGSNDRTTQLAVSAIAPCAKCGTPLVPEVMLQRILERFRRQKGDPADEAAMRLCHACKIGVAVGAQPTRDQR